jgi:2-dehydropantoate 2-reductase
MNIEEVAILGAGAVGASIAHQLIKRRNPAGSPPRISVIAEGERADRYRRDGLNVNGEAIRPEIAAEGDFDLVIVATKSYHLEEALETLDSCVGEQTLLMSLLNGIDSESILGGRYGHEKVIPAMILGIDAQRGDGGFSYTNDGVIHYGPNPAVVDQRDAVAALDSWFAGSGLGHQKSDDITKSLWRKFMINVGANQASAYYKARYRELQTETEARELMLSAIEEVVALSRLEKTGLTPGDIEDWKELLTTLDPTGMTSMAQDAVAGRRTEVDLFAGTVVAMAEKHGLDVPVNRMLLEALGD